MHVFTNLTCIYIHIPCLRVESSIECLYKKRWLLISFICRSTGEDGNKTGTDRYYDILLIDRTGQGKSTTGNILLDLTPKECSQTKYDWTEDRTIPFFIQTKGPDYSTRHCKILTNKHVAKLGSWTHVVLQTRCQKIKQFIKVIQKLFASFFTPRRNME